MAASVYYVDYTNGTDTAPGTNTFWGKREPVTSHYHAEAGSDATTTVCATSLVGSADDAYNGSFIWNRTRGLGAYITDYVHSTHTLTHGSIAGNANTDEFYIINAWKTTSKAATTAAVGDIVYIRAGLTDTLAAIVNFTNDGTSSARISLIGTGTGSATLETTDETATEMWHDASTVRPIIDGNAAAYYVYLSSDDYWILQNLDMRNTTSSNYGCLTLNQLTYSIVTINNCILRDCSFSNVMFSTATTNLIIFNSCQFINGGSNNVVISNASTVVFNSCTFDSGAQVTDFGLYLGPGCIVYLNYCNFGLVSAHNFNDINITSGYVAVYTRGCVFNKIDYITPYSASSFIRNEDDDGVYGAQSIYTSYCVITKDTDVTRVGGATSSAKIMPYSTITTHNPATVTGELFLPDFRVWCTAAATTITVYIRSVTTWGGVYPTAAELWTETEYVTDDTTGAITRATELSTQVLSDATTWVGFTCGEFTPHVAGWVNIKVKLTKYVASNGIYVDIAPVIS